MAYAKKEQPRLTTCLDCTIKVIDLTIKIVVMLHVLHHM
jgi:putative NIF3 family GTP cyclohydrolase 1 type 2